MGLVPPVKSGLQAEATPVPSGLCCPKGLLPLHVSSVCIFLISFMHYLSRSTESTQRGMMRNKRPPLDDGLLGGVGAGIGRNEGTRLKLMSYGKA